MIRLASAPTPSGDDALMFLRLIENAGPRRASGAFARHDADYWLAVIRLGNGGGTTMPLDDYRACWRTSAPPAILQPLFSWAEEASVRLIISIVRAAGAPAYHRPLPSGKRASRELFSPRQR